MVPGTKQQFNFDTICKNLYMRMRIGGANPMDWALIRRYPRGVRMVCTRSKARQKAAAAGSQSAEEDVPQTVKTSARSARKTRRKSAAQLQEARDLNSDAGQTSGSRCIGGGEDGTESIEELALRAFRVMKERLEEEEGLGEDDRGEMEMDTNTRLDVMTLETKPDTMKEAVPGKLRRLSGVLPTSLQPRMEETPYFSYSRKKGLLGPLTGKAGSLSWGEGEEELMKKSVITSDFEKRDAAPPMHVSKHTRDKARRVSFCLLYPLSLATQ